MEAFLIMVLVLAVVIPVATVCVIFGVAIRRLSQKRRIRAANKSYADLASVGPSVAARTQASH